MGFGVRAKLDTGGGHLFDHRPGHIVGTALINRVGDEEDGGGEAKFLQDGKGIFVIVAVTVVDRDDDRFGR